MDSKQPTRASTEALPDRERYEGALDRAGTRTPGHPVRDDIRLLSPDFYARIDELGSWMRAHVAPPRRTRWDLS